MLALTKILFPPYFFSSIYNLIFKTVVYDRLGRYMSLDEENVVQECQMNCCLNQLVM